MLKSLSLAPVGEHLTIRKITGSDSVRQHLAELGFVVESEIEIIQSVEGDLIVVVKDARIALGKELAECIMVD